ncbi:MAG: hypothetical protein AAF915_12400 [Cyanobacteria bacterium P01_D01_bin.50]
MNLAITKEYGCASGRYFFDFPKITENKRLAVPKVFVIAKAKFLIASLKRKLVVF